MAASTSHSLLLVCALSLGAGCADYGMDKPDGLEDILPGQNDVSGLSCLEDPIRLESDTELYRQINGSAERYLRNGWLESVFSQGKSVSMV